MKLTIADYIIGIMFVVVEVSFWGYILFLGFKSLCQRHLGIKFPARVEDGRKK